MLALSNLFVIPFSWDNSTTGSHRSSEGPHCASLAATTGRTRGVLTRMRKGPHDTQAGWLATIVLALKRPLQAPRQRVCWLPSLKDNEPTNIISLYSWVYLKCNTSLCCFRPSVLVMFYKHLGILLLWCCHSSLLTLQTDVYQTLSVFAWCTVILKDLETSL